MTITQKSKDYGPWSMVILNTHILHDDHHSIKLCQVIVLEGYLGSLQQGNHMAQAWG